jgi:hypothetical protein
MLSIVGFEQSGESVQPFVDTFELFTMAKTEVLFVHRASVAGCAVCGRREHERVKPTQRPRSAWAFKAGNRWAAVATAHTRSRDVHIWKRSTLEQEGSTTRAERRTGGAVSIDKACNEALGWSASIPYGINVLQCIVYEWWSGRGSNPRPSHCERDALPAELPPREL